MNDDEWSRDGCERSPKVFNSQTESWNSRFKFFARCDQSFKKYCQVKKQKKKIIVSRRRRRLSNGPFFDRDWRICSDCGAFPSPTACLYFGASAWTHRNRSLQRMTIRLLRHYKYIDHRALRYWLFVLFLFLFLLTTAGCRRPAEVKVPQVNKKLTHTPGLLIKKRKMRWANRAISKSLRLI